MSKLTGVAFDYIHLNPVRAGIVEKEEEYLNSFALIIMEQEKIQLNWRNFNRIGNPPNLASTSGGCRRANERKEVKRKKERKLLKISNLHSLLFRLISSFLLT